MSLPVNTPAECLSISPEALEVANNYLQTQNILDVSNKLGITPEQVTQYLAKREVKAYIDAVFFDYGFNNRFKLRAIMDKLIDHKLEEMQEAEVGSSKDITELLALSHKMTMDTLDKQIKLEQIKASNIIKSQTNIQVNGMDGGGNNYQALLDRLINSKNT